MVMNVPGGTDGAALKLKLTAIAVPTDARLPSRNSHCVPLKTAIPGAAVVCVANPALVEGKHIALLGSPGGYS